MRARDALALTTLLALGGIAGVAVAAAPQASMLLNGATFPPAPDPGALVAPADPGDLALARAMAEGVGLWVDRGVSVADFETGASLFDREWLFGTYQMAALGYGQLAARDPEHRDRWIGRMEACLARLDDPDTLAFDVRSWREDPLTGDRGHAAWLGYTGLALSYHRTLVAEDRFAALEERVAEALARRVEADPYGLPETYPGERYPVDVSAGVAALLLHARATGGDDAVPRRWLAEVLPRYRDRGLLVQAVGPDGRASDAPRGSGTFLAAFFLGLADPAAGGDLYGSGRDGLYTEMLGLGGMREYPADRPGRGDVDSGPIFLGLGVSSTGFAIGPALTAGDDATARRLFATAQAFGGAHDREEPGVGRVRTWSAGPLGDAILFAMVAGG